MLCLHREKPPAGPITMPLPFPIMDPVPVSGVIPGRARGVLHLVTSSGHSRTLSLREEEQHIPHGA